MRASSSITFGVIIFVAWLASTGNTSAAAESPSPRGFWKKINNGGRVCWVSLFQYLTGKYHCPPPATQRPPPRPPRPPPHRPPTHRPTRPIPTDLPRPITSRPPSEGGLINMTAPEISGRASLEFVPEILGGETFEPALPPPNLNPRHKQGWKHIHVGSHSCWIPLWKYLTGLLSCKVTNDADSPVPVHIGKNISASRERISRQPDMITDINAGIKSGESTVSELEEASSRTSPSSGPPQPPVSDCKHCNTHCGCYGSGSGLNCYVDRFQRGHKKDDSKLLFAKVFVARIFIFQFQMCCFSILVCNHLSVKPDECMRNGQFYGDTGVVCKYSGKTSGKCNPLRTIIGVNMGATNYTDSRGIKYTGWKISERLEGYHWDFKLISQQVHHLTGISGDDACLYNYQVTSIEKKDNTHCIRYIAGVEDDGWYSFTMKTLEPALESKDGINRRSFNVRLGGHTVLKEVDIWSVHGKLNHATDITVNFQVKTDPDNRRRYMHLKGFDRMQVWNSRFDVKFCQSDCGLLGHIAVCAFNVVQLTKMKVPSRPPPPSPRPPPPPAPRPPPPPPPRPTQPKCSDCKSPCGCYHSNGLVCYVDSENKGHRKEDGLFSKITNQIIFSKRLGNIFIGLNLFLYNVCSLREADI